MATVNYLFRSTKNIANLTLRLLFRHNDNDFVYATNTQIEVSKEYWLKQHKQERPKDIEIKNKQTEIKAELNKIENYILNAFNKVNPNSINKEWLQNQIDTYYNPQNIDTLPTDLISYIGKYKEMVRNEVTESTIKKCNSIIQLLTRYQLQSKRNLLLTDIDVNFKIDFENYCLTQNYAPNTIARTIRFIKTFCKHAKLNGLETNYQLDNIKVKYLKVETIYLTFEDLELIEKLQDNTLNTNYQNAKDWLIISCYTGQRVSDFMRFTTEMIRTENGKDLIEFTQKKTNKIMTVPLHPKVKQILNKRNGQFPKAITDQKYNDYIKEVCKLAGLTQQIQGSKKLETSPQSKQFRKETGTFEKWELVTSHIGRRSFATNFYGKIPTTYLTYVTGHSTEVMFLNYIGKSNKDLALEMTKYF